jgi:hypothetical protein
MIVFNHARPRGRGPLGRTRGAPWPGVRAPRCLGRVGRRPTVAVERDREPSTLMALGRLRFPGRGARVDLVSDAGCPTRARRRLLVLARRDRSSDAAPGLLLLPRRDSVRFAPPGDGRRCSDSSKGAVGRRSAARWRVPVRREAARRTCTTAGPKLRAREPPRHRWLIASRHRANNTTKAHCVRASFEEAPRLRRVRSAYQTSMGRSGAWIGLCSAEKSMRLLTDVRRGSRP